MVAVGAGLQGQDRDCAEDGFDLPRQPPRTTLRSSVTQLASNDDARQDVVFSNGSDAAGDRPCGWRTT
jgi:hypothetical protein